jgi:hypothetical protein
MYMKQIFQALILVFSDFSYWVIAGVAAVLFFFINLWLLNLGYLKYLVRHSSVGFLDKVISFFNIKILVLTRLMPLEFAIVVSIALLTGINIAMAIYLMRRNLLVRGTRRLAGISAVAALLGVGCLSCGTSLLAALIGVVASTTLLGLLPFHGLELSFFAIVILLFSIWQLSRKVMGPESCQI